MALQKIKLFQFSIGIVLLLSGCNIITNNEGQLGIIPEQVLFVSSERVRLSGRIVSYERLAISDHGFLISESENFLNPIVISLGQRETPGLFIGETSGLKLGRQYFWKPFAIVDGRNLEGSAGSFNTLEPEVSSFQPTGAFEGQILTINGRNFPSDTQVFFDDREATVTKIDKESKIELRIPNIGISKIAVIKIVAQGKEIMVGSFEYIIGKWEFVNNFITTFPYQYTVSFTSGNQFIFGLGYEGIQFNPTLWSLDIPSWTWSTTSFNQTPVILSFSAPSHFGAGRMASGAISTNFYSYENSQFTRKADLPFRLVNSVSIRVNDMLYIYGGEDANRIPNNRIYRYIISEDRWETYSSHPIKIESKYPLFTYNGLVYYISSDRQVQVFDPGFSEAMTISTFPSSAIQNGNGICQVIGDKAYIGLFDQSRELWEYNITENTWKQKTGFTGVSLFTSTVASFTDGIHLYIFKNPRDGQSNGMSIWRFKPEEF